MEGKKKGATNLSIRCWNYNAGQVGLYPKASDEEAIRSREAIYSTPLPSGGVGISFEIVGAWSRRQDRRKFMARGSAFLQYGADGKIERLRLYLTETAEVVAL